MHFTSTASVVGSRLVRCAHWTTGTGSSKSMDTSYLCDLYPSSDISSFLSDF